MLALAGPRIRGTAGQGQRYVLAIDNSASMSATDVAPEPPGAGQGRRPRRSSTAMEADDLAMVIAFSDRARVVSNYTGNRRLLLQRIDAIEPTQATTSLREALQVAAGLANPSRQYRREGVVATSVVTAQAPDLHRRRLRRRRGVQPGQPRARGRRDRPAAAPRSPRPIAEPGAERPAEDALRQRRDPRPADAPQRRAGPTTTRSSAASTTTGPRPSTTEAQLLRHDPAKPGDAGHADRRHRPEDPRAERPVVQVRPARPGRGRAGGPARPSTTPCRSTTAPSPWSATRGRPRSWSSRRAIATWSTPSRRRPPSSWPTSTIVTPDEAKSDADRAATSQAGRFDLVIYDRVRPETPPEANTLYFGALPPGPALRQLEGRRGAGDPRLGRRPPAACSTSATSPPSSSSRRSSSSRPPAPRP